MKRIVIVIVVAAGLGCTAWTARWLLAQGRDADDTPSVERPVVREIVDKTVASGRIVPAREVSVKSRMTGVVEHVFVVPGQRVRRGDPLVNIGPVPDELRLSELRAALNEATIDYEYADHELTRTRRLADAGVEASSKLDAAQRELDQRALALRVARERFRLVRDGGTGASGHKGNIVRATADGTVMDIPLQAGDYVIEAGPLGAGTTVAMIADTDDMLFVGQVDEADAGALRVSMPLEIRVAALSDRKFSGSLEFIAPKSRAGEGPTTFEIKASIARGADTTLRAGYSANAEIVLARVEHALSVREAVLQFENDRTFVDVVTETGRVERREVRTGLSDGLYVEIRGGIGPEVALHVPASE